MRTEFLQRISSVLIIAILAASTARLFSLIYSVNDFFQVLDSIPLFLDKVYGISSMPWDDNKLLVPTLTYILSWTTGWSILFSWEIMRFVVIFVAGLATYHLVRKWCERGIALLLVALTYFVSLLSYTVALRDHPTDFGDIFFVAVILSILVGRRGKTRWWMASLLMLAFGFNRALAPFLGVALGVILIGEAGGVKPLFFKLRQHRGFCLGLVSMMAVGYLAQLNAKTIGSRNLPAYRDKSYLERLQIYAAIDRNFVRGMWWHRRELDRDALNEWGGQLASRHATISDPLTEIVEMKKALPLPSSIEDKQRWMWRHIPYPDGLTGLILIFLTGASVLLVASRPQRFGSKWTVAAFTGVLLTNFLGGYLDEGRQSLWVLPLLAIGLAEYLTQTTRFIFEDAAGSS